MLEAIEAILIIISMTCLFVAMFIGIISALLF